MSRPRDWAKRAQQKRSGATDTVVSLDSRRQKKRRQRHHSGYQPTGPEAA